MQLRCNHDFVNNALERKPLLYSVSTSRKIKIYLYRDLFAMLLSFRFKDINIILSGRPVLHFTNNKILYYVNYSKFIYLS